MAKDPAFLFYPGDWLGGTIGMSFEEKGAYMELLMMQFTRGHMTSHMIGQTVGQLWVKLQDKFVQDDQGLWYNVRLDIEKEKRKKFTDSRKNNKKGSNQHTDNNGHKVGHMTSHMENVNENVNSSSTLLLRKEIEDAIFKDQMFMDELQMNHKGKDVKASWNKCWTHHSQSPNPPTEVWLWKQKLNSWLTISKEDKIKKQPAGLVQ